MDDPLAWLEEAAAARVIAGLQRSPRERVAHDAVLELASNDYLGMARNPEVSAAAAKAAIEWGAGATGSRLVTGTTELHLALESELADFVDFESALICSTGYHANLAAVTALTGPDSFIVSDAGNHASLVDACRLSRAQIAVTPHRNVAAVDHALTYDRDDREHAVVLTDGVFSADGDLAPLVELHSVARSHGAVLVVDEAHAFGVLGPGGQGAVASAGLAGEPDVVITGTLSKSLGSQGGFVMGPSLVREHLLNTARAFVFDTGLAPPAVAAAAQSLRLLQADPSLAATVRQRAADIAEIVGVDPPDAGVVSVVLGTSHRALETQQKLLEQGVWVGCFRPPSVPEGTSRLRITARADLTDREVELFATAWAQVSP